MFTLKKTVLPLSHAEKIQSALRAFHEARDILVEVQEDILDEIDIKQTELEALNARHQEASDALTRIRAITG